MLRKSMAGFPQTPSDGDLVYEGADQQYLGDTLIPDVPTYYTVFAHTDDDQYSTPDNESQIRVIVSGAGIGNDPALPKNAGYLTSYPNPFNANTVLNYRLIEPGEIRISIYNIAGQKMATLFDGNQDAGEHKITWEASQYPSGVYFAKLESAQKTETKKLLLLK
jgi:hypothetical protein